MSQKSISNSIMKYFPYDEMREAQQKGVPEVENTADLNGFLLLEGACGTGKTMLALSPLISKVRDNSTKLDRVLVITSVKQQLRAFEEAVDDINNNLPEHENVVSLTLTGKSGMHPYVRTGAISQSAVYDTDAELRDSTRELIYQAGESLEEKRDFARTLYQDAEGKSALNSKYPYPEDIPTYETDTEDEVPYNPYYARYLAGTYSEEMDSAGPDAESVVPFNPGQVGTINSETIFKKSALQNGVSPSSVMEELMGEVDVVVANYAHVFDHTTVNRMTGELISDNTAVVIDEAHNLVPRVRDSLGEEVAFSSLKKTTSELEEVVGWLTGETAQTQEATSTAQGLFQKVPEVNIDDMRALKQVIEKIYKKMGDKTTDFLNEEYSGWENMAIDSIDFPLRDPEKVQPDYLTQWLNLSGNRSLISNAREVTKLAFTIRSKVYEKHFGRTRPPDSTLKSVGRILTMWDSVDHSTFYRQIRLEEAQNTPSDKDFEWEKQYRATLQLKNCLPRERIAKRLDEFGCGVLMSATLEPFDVFKNISGMNVLKDKGRPVLQRRYGLKFPKENRTSVAVDSNVYSSSNRGSALDKYNNPNLDNDTRREYADIIHDVVENSDGNVLVVMPKYEEAKWAGRVLEHESTLPTSKILVDEKSLDHETEELKQNFFEGGKKVLCTSALGTLIEGVDYDGGKLSSVVVCGLPLENPYEPSQKAIRTAYKEEFGYEHDFEYAFSLPAVYRARQAIGRVIRSHEDVGVRVLADSRYVRDRDDLFSSVKHLFPEDEYEEFSATDSNDLNTTLETFWNSYN